MSFEIKVIMNHTGIDQTKWSHFIASHPNANFFQSPKAFQFFESAENYQPFLFVALENNEIVGSLLAVVIQEGHGVKGYFSRRSIIWGGPLTKDRDNKIAETILEEYDRQIMRRAIYSQFRNLFDLSNLKELFISNGYSFDEHLNLYVDLTKTEDELWSEVHSKRRNEIRRAEKEGTTFQLSDKREDVHKTYEILKQVYTRAKLPLPEVRFFQTAYDHIGAEHFKIFLAVNHGKIIGTMYTICYKDTIYDWYAGSYQEYYQKYPNDLIPWQVFLWGKQHGYKKFDFGGAGKPGVPYGVREYKKKFGGKFVNYGRFEKIHKPVLFKIAKLGFKFYQKFKH